MKAIGEYLNLTFSSDRVAFLDLYTVGFIEAVTAKACEQRDGVAGQASDGAISVRFPNHPCALEVRRIVSRLLNISADHINADSDLGPVDPVILASLISELNARWQISIDSSFEQVIQATKTNKQGNLTASSRKQLGMLLPSVDFNSTKVVHASIVNRLGILEAIIDRDTAGQNVDQFVVPHEPIFRLSGLRWTDEDSQSLFDRQKTLGENGTRRLMGACCRLSITPKSRWEPIALRAIDAVVKLASTGRFTKEITAVAKELTEDWEREGIPALKALSAALERTLPDDALVIAAQALATKENLTQRDAVQRVLGL